MTKCVLGDVADVIISGVDKKTKDGEERVRLCNYTDVYYNWAITGDKHDGLMEASAKPEEIRKFKIRKGQVALTKDSETRDDIGIPTYIADDFEDVILGYHCALITPHGKQLDGSYLNALLRTKYAKEFFANNAGGSGQRYYLSEASIRELPLFLPDVAEQKRIGKFLSSIDRKIALNRKRIATLEAMAKEIYDYWFVQFDFPNAHGRPYKSSGGEMVYNPDLKREIPKGWEVCRIGDHITANRGISYSTKNISSGNGVPMINLNSFNVDSSYKVKGIKMFDGEIPSTRRIAPYDLVMCNTQQTDLDPCKDIIGKSFLVPDIFEGTIVSSHHVTTIHVDDDNLKVYLNALFHTREFHAYIAGYASGTSIRGLNFLGVENCYIAVPHMPLLSKFANLALSCEKEKSRILRNQKMLQALRDFILPLLMNGQAKVG